MRSRLDKNHGITHSLTPFLQQTQRQLAQYQVPDQKLNNYTPLFSKDTHYNPHKQRSRKHRLVEEKNTDIQRENRRLYEKLRKIKLKNAYQSEQKINMDTIPQTSYNSFGQTLKPLSLPQVSHYSMNSTKNQLNNILNNTKTFVNKYFEELGRIGGKGNKKTEQLGNFNCNGWKVKVLLLDDQYIILRGRKGGKQLSKKYQWARVNTKMNSGLEEWVRLKFEFED